LVTTPLRYQDDTSRSCVRQFLYKTLDRYGQQFAIPLIRQIESQLNSFYVSGRSCLLYSRISVDVLSWLEHVPVSIDLDVLDDDTLRSYVQSLAFAASLIVVNQHSVHLTKLDDHFDRLHSLGNKHVAVIGKHLSRFSVEQHPLEQIALWAYLLVSRKGQTSELFASDSSKPLDIFVKQVIPSRVRLEKTLLLANHGKFIGQIVTEPIFTQQLLPAFQKALLRNPEVAFEFLIPLLQHCKFNLDDHVDPLSKLIATQLISKQECLAESAVIASKQLGLKCKTVAALTKLIKHYSAVYNGSEGKLTTVQQRCSLASGLGAVAACQTSFDDKNLQQIAEIAVQSLTSFTKNEAHEATLLHIASQLNVWAENLRLSAPNDLLSWYKTAIAAKTTASPVRSAFTSVIKSALNPSTLHQICPLLSNLTASLSKVSTIAAGQQGMLIEALQNFNLFLKVFYLDSSKTAQFESVINAIVAVEKLQFLNEKFISSAPQGALLELCFFIKLSLTLFEAKLETKQR
jgi:hypothetical protein